jgi:cholest-4-en-3-one 26-monooxygenase
VEVSRNPECFSNQPRFQIIVGADYASDDEREPETIIHMDPPRHRAYRDVLSRRFTPRALQALEPRIAALSRGTLDALAEEAREAGGELGFDFVERVAAPIPIAVIAWWMDVPTEDWPKLFDWTNAVVVPSEPAYQLEGETPHETRLRASAALYEYFGALGHERRDGAGDDLVSVLARARVGGEPLGAHELVSYYLLLIAAGNETTRNAISGGLQAFLDFPDQWRALREDPAGRARRASEEILRWSTPVLQMARTATRDVELAGTKIREGETLALYYASANRDESVFEDPFAFRIDRHPNPHLALGIGEHVCMGGHLARLELRLVFQQLAERFAEFVPDGRPERVPSCNVEGLKSFPVRARLAGAEEGA